MVAHCLFEQSGTFKNEFKKLSYEAYDYDIQNEFGETDYVIDLFAEIEGGYQGKPSIFDNISTDDLILAFSLVRGLRQEFHCYLEERRINRSCGLI